MAFQLKASNSLAQLAENLSELMANFKGSVFDPVTVVTQTEGMNNWLKIKMAEHSGIAANIRFYKPNELISKIYYLLGGPFAQVFSGRNLEWLLYKELGEPNFIKKYPSVAGYYQEGGKLNDLKRIALADVVADLFDQYQIYRPDMIHNWNQSKIKIDNEKWQMELWQATKQFAGAGFTDKITISNFIKEALNDPEKVNKLQQAMPSIYLFGISVLTEYHLDIFQSLSPHLDIEFFILNPAPEEYWFEDRSPKLISFLKSKGILSAHEESIGNELLTSWGKIIRDTFSLLFKHEELINGYDPLPSKVFEHDTLLNKIQNLIVHNQKIEINYFTEKNLDDGTIAVSSCQSEAREVEILYNYLVHLVDKKKQQLSSRDILVMVSDIDAYASYIRAVFDNAPYRFDYNIADESYASLDSISNALLAILNLSNSNFTSENILRLLDFSSIKNGLEISDTELIQRTVDAAKIRFGIEGKKEDDTYLISWLYGLKRIIYGIAISGGEEYGEGEDSFFPLDNLESNKAYDVIRFLHFVESIMQLIHDRENLKSISGWVDHVRKTLELFIPTNSEIPDEDYGALLLQLEQYNEVNVLMKDEIEYGVFLRAFQPTLATTKCSYTFAGEGITFCSLIPMRSIPFKVVAMLGLNSNIFPRKEEKIQFDLMQNEKRKGDRNLKENDRHLFLETLNSAGDFLYLSYIGQNSQDNATLPPSGLIDELLDFIEQGAEHPEQVRTKLMTVHPIHRFSSIYSSNDPRYYSYLLESAKELDNIILKEKNPAPDVATITIKDLMDFAKEPVKYYYNQVLKIYLSDEEISLSETELLDLNHLQEWSLKQELLEIDDTELGSLSLQKRKKGELPLKNMADVFIEKNLTEIVEIKEIFRELIAGQTKQTIAINLSIGDYQLVGDIDDIYGNKALSICTSNTELKYLITGYLRHLILAAAGHSHDFHFLSGTNKKQFICNKISKDDAINELEEIIELFKKGNENKILFYPRIKIDWGKNDGTEIEKFFKKLKESIWSSKDKKYYCLYLKRHFAHHDSFTEEEFLLSKDFINLLVTPLNDFYPDYDFKIKNDA